MAKSLEQADREMREATVAAGFSEILDDPEAAERAIEAKWWDKGIKGLLKDLSREHGADFETEHVWIYSQLSDHAHAGPRMLQKFVEQVSEASINMLYRPRRSDKLTLPWSVTDWMCQIAHLVARAFDLRFENAVVFAQAMAKSLLRDE